MTSLLIHCRNKIELYKKDEKIRCFSSKVNKITQTNLSNASNIVSREFLHKHILLRKL